MIRRILALSAAVAVASLGVVGVQLEAAVPAHAEETVPVAPTPEVTDVPVIVPEIPLPTQSPAPVETPAPAEPTAAPPAATPAPATPVTPAVRPRPTRAPAAPATSSTPKPVAAVPADLASTPTPSASGSPSPTRTASPSPSPSPLVTSVRTVVPETTTNRSALIAVSALVGSIALGLGLLVFAAVRNRETLARRVRAAVRHARSR
jgi:hypothetical protein